MQNKKKQESLLGQNNEKSNSSESASKEEGSSSDSEQKSEEDESKNNKIFSLSRDVILSDKEDNMQIEWEEIKKDVENLYSIWATISIDLKSIGANSDDILQFNKVLDDIAKSVKQEDKNASIIGMSKLYALIPKYMESFSDDELKKCVFITKSHILNAYAQVDNNDWNKINEELKLANESFSKIDKEKIDSNKELNINRCELLLKELLNSTEKRDKQIFYLRYKNALQELNIL